MEDLLKENKLYTDSLNISVTGARSGDIIQGIQKCTKNATIKVNGNIYPIKRRLNDIIENGMWISFIHKLSEIPFFSCMKFEERELWLGNNQSNEEFISLDPLPLSGKILDIGESDIGIKLSDSQIDTVMNIDDLNFSEIEDLFPRNPGGEDFLKKHTLFFLKQYWNIYTDCKTVDSYSGIIYNIECGIRLSGEFIKSDRDFEIIVVPNITLNKDKKGEVGFYTRRERMNLDNDTLNRVILDIYKTDIDTIDKIRSCFKGYTPASYKSLLQKIIRFTPIKISLFDNDVDTKLVLIVVCCCLVQHPGSFVPDIRRFVSGLESLTKRLGIIGGYEDSYIEKVEINKLLSLFSASLLSQRVRAWRPNYALLKQWLLLAIYFYSQDYAYIYNIKRGLSQAPYYCEADNQTVIEHCCALLEELKTFETDIGMARYISLHYDTLKLTKLTRRYKIMPICHFVDHHCATGIIYFYHPTIIYRYCAPQDKSPFKNLFYKLFDEIVGINPRRLNGRSLEGFALENKCKIVDCDKSENLIFFEESRLAQNLYLTSKQMCQVKRDIKENNYYILKYRLNISWLSGLVGAIEIKGNTPILITLRPEDPYQLIAIRKPTRNMSGDISPEKEEKAKQIARTTILKHGIKLTNGGITGLDYFKDKKLFLIEDEEYRIGTSVKNSKTWSQVCDLEFKIPYHKSIRKNIKNALIYIGDGIEENAFDKLDELINSTDKNILYRVIYYIDNFNSIIEMNKISREGGAIHYSVSLHDIPCYQFLLTVSQIFPIALRPHSAGKFTVILAPMMWTICSIIKNVTDQKITEISWKEGCGINIYDRIFRTPWVHQIETVEEMKEAYNYKIKGIFLYLFVGMGKTMIVMMYCMYLESILRLPKYIIYTLPSSAIKSVVYELQCFGFSINYIIPLKNIKSKIIPKNVVVNQEVKLLPYHINLICHDHMRICKDELIKYANTSLFIIDEVHKLLNETKKTSVALEISYLSRQFITLTGTPIIDNKIYKLMPWLKQIVRFQVSNKNFFVSANSIIARKASTGIKVDKKEIVANFTDEELKEHRKYIPIKMGGENTYPTFDDFNKDSKLCYIVCDRKMIQETLTYINEKRGVFLVSRNIYHKEKLKRLLIQAGISVKDIFVLDRNDSIFLTDEMVESNKIYNYKVVIASINQSEGYSLTRLNVIITSVYPSNQAKRIQIEGRINRIGQKRKTIDIRIIHCGILTYILKHHNESTSLSLALMDLAKDIHI